MSGTYLHYPVHVDVHLVDGEVHLVDGEVHLVQKDVIEVIGTEVGSSSGVLLILLWEKEKNSLSGSFISFSFLFTFLGRISFSLIRISWSRTVRGRTEELTEEEEDDFFRRRSVSYLYLEKTKGENCH